MMHKTRVQKGLRKKRIDSKQKAAQNRPGDHLKRHRIKRREKQENGSTAEHAYKQAKMWRWSDNKAARRFERDKTRCQRDRSVLEANSANR